MKAAPAAAPASQTWQPGQTATVSLKDGRITTNGIESANVMAGY